MSTVSNRKRRALHPSGQTPSHPVAEPARLKTPEEAKAHLEKLGLSIAQFARDHDLPYGIVWQVLDGAKKGRRGEAHRAAVLLGIKDGVVSPPATRA